MLLEYCVTCGVASGIRGTYCDIDDMLVEYCGVCDMLVEYGVAYGVLPVCDMLAVFEVVHVILAECGILAVFCVLDDILAEYIGVYELLDVSM